MPFQIVMHSRNSSSESPNPEGDVIQADAAIDWQFCLCADLQQAEVMVVLPELTGMASSHP